MLWVYSLPTQDGHIQHSLHLKRSDVAPQAARSIGGARVAALIGGQGHAEMAGAAARVAGINRRAARQERLGLGWTAVVREQAQQGIGQHDPAAADAAIRQGTQDIVAL